MIKGIFTLVIGTLFSAAIAGEVHGGINFEVCWTNTTSPLDEAIKDI